MKIVNGFQPVSIFAKSSILHVSLGSEYVPAYYDYKVDIRIFL